jgi:hypothetical protein
MNLKLSFDKLFFGFKKWFISLLLIPVCYYLISARGQYSWIDNADLVIHEAGHVFFSPFGKFIYTLGGTMMQIILPSIIALFFFTKLYRTGVQISLLWLGQNLINISVYVADAKAQSLPLLGGKKVYHDWNYILSQLNILDYYSEVNFVFIAGAILIFLASIFMPLIIRN